MIVINATNELLKEYYGETPKSSLKSVVVMDNGKPICVSGLKVQNNIMLWFADISDEFREHPKFKRGVILCYRKLWQVMPSTPVYAYADPEIEGSGLLLKHIGFKHITGDTWRV